MKHLGNLINKRLHDLGVNKSVLSKKLGISRVTLNNRLKKADLSVNFINQIAKVIRYDFSMDIPELGKFSYNTSEPTEQYGINQVIKSQKEKIDLLQKIIESQHEQIDAYKKTIDVLERRGEGKRGK